MHCLRLLTFFAPIIIANSYVINSSPVTSVEIVETSLATIGNEVVSNTPLSERYALAERATISFSFPGLSRTLLTAATLLINKSILTAACGAGGPISCAIAATYSAFAFYFVAFKVEYRHRDVNQGDEIFVRYPALPEKTHLERLTTELETGVWHNIGWSHVSGKNHTMLFINYGTHQVIRAWQQSSISEAISTDPKLTKRQGDQYDSGGFVVDYQWEFGNQQAYDAFGSDTASTQYYADNLAEYMITNQQSILSCADFGDQDGRLDGGLLSIGWNNVPFEFQDGQSEALLQECNNI